MTPSEILRKIRRIQIRTSHRVDGMLAGTWHSAFKGRGIEFEEVRPYQVGDDVRTIDWNVTARQDAPFVKLFREERELAVMLMVDCSASLDFGTQSQTKRELVTELGATLAMSAIKNNDRVGLTLFSEDVEKSFPPRQGSRHVLRLIREMLTHPSSGSGTDVGAALEHLQRTAKRRTVVFLISDFQSKDFEKSLRVASRKHDLIPVVVMDVREMEMPAVGLVPLRDNETGDIRWIDTSSRKHRERYAQMVQQREERRDALFRRYRMEPLHLRTGEDLGEPLRRYFHRRENRR
ncbi:DUF58 domain-containing protein [Rhodopirellula baltica]|uniref:Protein containing DUF58 n=1 Tax=Rhodopirellula baltica SWK14 TaxID=993516 RepID=L7C944_RHOBT|nr:DUF58 domain-containing protein [Rhodopirellula baltica]ELP30704.1 protein containing DUF58 [Rhodopirellula baltica SWK14]